MTYHPVEALRDYAFGELPADRQPELEQHLGVCGECTLELDRLRLTTAALRTLPDREIPQRIAFVSDKVFEPSPMSRFFGGFWNSAARLGFASACVLGAALVVSAYHRPAEVRTAVQTGNVQTGNVQAANADVSKQVNDAVTKAVAQVKVEDAREIETVGRKYEQEYQDRMTTVAQNFELLQKQVGTSLIVSYDMRGNGDGQ
jgi:negative regulator of sigma E activity